jgi:hypothetical protein
VKRWITDLASDTDALQLRQPRPRASLRRFTTDRIAIAIQNILLRVPQILVCFVRLRLPLLFLEGREAFGFLGSPGARIAGCLGCCFTAGEKHRANDRANELKVHHIYLSISRHGPLVTSCENASTIRLGILKIAATRRLTPGLRKNLL